jgi:nicotinamidase-related amidase
MPEKTALLVMDVQDGIVERIGDPDLLGNVRRAIDIARHNGLQVMYVRVAFRPGYPEVSPRNKGFSALLGSGALIEEESRIHASVAPRDGEPVITKKRVSAFAGSDLDVVLRAGEVRSLVLCGIATSGVVLSTVRAAADMDYELTVLADCCADGDPEVHRVLLEKVFPRQAAVLGVADWERRLG